VHTVRYDSKTQLVYYL